MVALTYDKMAEFYAFQQRYEEAEAESTQALALRTAQHPGQRLHAFGQQAKRRVAVFGAAQNPSPGQRLDAFLDQAGLGDLAAAAFERAARLRKIPAAKPQD